MSVLVDAAVIGGGVQGGRVGHLEVQIFPSDYAQHVLWRLEQVERATRYAEMREVPAFHSYGRLRVGLSEVPAFVTVVDQLQPGAGRRRIMFEPAQSGGFTQTNDIVDIAVWRTAADCVAWRDSAAADHQDEKKEHESSLSSSASPWTGAASDAPGSPVLMFLVQDCHRTNITPRDIVQEAVARARTIFVGDDALSGPELEAISSSQLWCGDTTFVDPDLPLHADSAFRSVPKTPRPGPPPRLDLRPLQSFIKPARPA
jgi:hypothetical protein